MQEHFHHLPSRERAEILGNCHNPLKAPAGLASLEVPAMVMVAAFLVVLAEAFLAALMAEETAVVPVVLAADSVQARLVLFASLKNPSADRSAGCSRWRLWVRLLWPGSVVRACRVIASSNR